MVAEQQLPAKAAKSISIRAYRYITAVSLPINENANRQLTTPLCSSFAAGFARMGLNVRSCSPTTLVDMHREAFGTSLAAPDPVSDISGQDEVQGWVGLYKICWRHWQAGGPRLLSIVQILQIKLTCPRQQWLATGLEAACHLERTLFACAGASCYTSSAYNDDAAELCFAVRMGLQAARNSDFQKSKSPITIFMQQSQHPCHLHGPACGYAGSWERRLAVPGDNESLQAGARA